MSLDTRTKIALAAMAQRPVVAARHLFGRTPDLVTKRGGISWALDLREGIDFSIWLLGAFERRTVAAYQRIVRPGAVVFDIGANVGAHALPLAKMVGSTGRVYAFEPVTWALQKLQANLRLNPDLAGRVSVNQIMLTDSPQKVVPDSIYSSWPLSGAEPVHEILRARNLPTTGARATTLDMFVSEAGVTRLDFIKLDVDGGECAVLRGARETLARLRPAVIVELSPYILEQAGESLDVLLDLLEGAGYALQDLGGKPLPGDRQALKDLIPTGGGINALAHIRSHA